MYPVSIPRTAVSKPFRYLGQGEIGASPLLFETYAMSLIEMEMPVRNAASLLGEYDQRFWVAQVGENTSYEEGITKVGLDETSSKKGHCYVTIGVDLEERRVFEVVEGKDAAAVEKLGAFHEDNGSPKSEVSQLSIDMSPAFVSGCMNTFENGAITFDHFHVTKVVNKAMDELRKREKAECELLKGHKYTFLRNPMGLSDKKMDQLFEMIELYPKVGEGYRLKLLFMDFGNVTTRKKQQHSWKNGAKKQRKAASSLFRMPLKPSGHTGRESSITQSRRFQMVFWRASTPKYNWPGNVPEGSGIRRTSLA